MKVGSVQSMSALGLLSLSVFMMASCTSEQTNVSGDRPSTDLLDTGTIRLHLETGDDDVAGFRFEVYRNEESLVESRFVPLEEESFASELLPGAGPGHRFADALFVLSPERYRVVARPMRSAAEPSADCQPAYGHADVQSGATVEVILVSRCDRPGTGGLDIVVVTNHAPELQSVQLHPSKFLLTCERLQLQASASDPDSDPFVFDWAVVTEPAGAIHDLTQQGSQAEFLPRTAGEFELRARVCDTLPPPDGLCSAVTFPIHVQPGAEECPRQQTVIWTTDADFARGLGENAVAVEDALVIDRFGVQATPTMWISSQGTSQVFLYDTTTRLPINGSPFATCAGPRRLGVDHDGNVFVGCFSTSVVMKLSPQGAVLWQRGLPSCGGALGGVFVPRLGQPDRLYLGCQVGGILVLNAETGAPLAAADGAPLDPGTGLPINAIQTPWAFSLVTDGQRVFGVREASPYEVQALDVQTHTVAWQTSDQRPYGLAWGESGLWFSSFAGRNQTCVLDPVSGLLARGNDPQLSCVTLSSTEQRGVAISPVDGLIWVVETYPSGPAKVAKIDPDGPLGAPVLLQEYPLPGGSPIGVVVDLANHVFVIRTGDVVKLDSAGNVLDTFGGGVLANVFLHSSDILGVTIHELEARGVWTAEEVALGAGTVEAIAWDAALPDDTELVVQYRLDRAGPWVTAVQGAGVAGVHDVIQLRVLLRSLQPEVRPSLFELRLTYSPGQDS